MSALPTALPTRAPSWTPAHDTIVAARVIDSDDGRRLDATYARARSTPRGARVTIEIAPWG